MRSRYLQLVTSGVFAITTFSTLNIHAATWDATTDYSGANNPNGDWSYGRKFTAGGGFDLMTVQWGGSGWYLGNVGHGGPSILAGPQLWAKNNTNGMPAVRWTSPMDGVYNLDTIFEGTDNRGVDNFVYVAINGNLEFSDRVSSYLDTAEFSLGNISLMAGDNIDFMLKWAGGVNSGCRCSGRLHQGGRCRRHPGNLDELR